MSDIKYCKQEKPASEKDLLTFRVLVIKNTLDFAPLLDEIAIETQLIGGRWDKNLSPCPTRARGQQSWA